MGRRVCSHRARVIVFVACAVLAPVVASAQWYAQSVVASDPEVTDPNNACGQEDAAAAWLPPGASITLDMDTTFGDGCLYWDICIYTAEGYSNNIIVGLSEDDVNWEAAEVIRTSPNVWADMAGNACANIGKRWRYIRIVNMEPENGNTVGIDAVEDVFSPANKFKGERSQTTTPYPYPSDLCNCAGSSTVPSLGPYGAASLLVLILISGSVLLVVKVRRHG